MVNQVLPAKYANALFLAAKDLDQIKKVKADLEMILKIFKENPEFEKVINHPGINKENKKQIIKEIFTSKINELSLNFLFLLIDKKRESLLTKIHDIFTERVYEYEGIKKLTIETAIPLSLKEKQYFAKEMGEVFKKKINIDTKVDLGILGGIIIRDKMTMIDASLKQFLNSLKNQIKETKVKKQKEIKKIKKNRQKVKTGGKNANKTRRNYKHN